ncbi:hypothetical protein N9S67_02470 [Candidatus Pelagibacter sp.]|nr:hypothetical protein [Candidatus Pelagibacter sp.]
MNDILRTDLIITLLISYFFFLILKKSKVFQYKFNIETHKNFVSKSEGINFLLGFILVSSYLIVLKILNVETISILAIFFIGLASDLKVLDSPKFRLFLQVVIALTFLTLTNLTISDIRIEWMNKILANNYLAIFFTAFCLAILLNGVNFIDGLNCNVLFYFLGVIFTLQVISNDANLDDLSFKYSTLVIILFILIALNFRGNNYLGDNGSYSLGFIIGILVIETHINLLEVSPYFFACLLWYPAYENLFSILRKLYSKKKPLEPDTQHFHQLLFMFIRNKLKINKYSNTMTSMIINIFNFLIFFIAYKNNTQTQFLVFLILASISIKTLLYYLLKKLRT